MGLTDQENEYWDSLLPELQKAFTPAEVETISSAYNYAAELHRMQKRLSGEMYLIHPIAVVRILMELGMDCETVCAALLHDVMEDCGVTLKMLSDKFGATVAALVDGVSKLGNIKYTSKDEQQSEDIRKMLLAMSHDIRVIIIKLADRLHNMRTLSFQSETKQREKALETMELYAPIAHRLGMWALKNEMEDIAIRCLDPVACAEIEEQIGMDVADQEEFLESFKVQIREKFADCGFEFKIDGRVKSIYGIYRKIYLLGRDVYDIFAIRIIVNTVHECYIALGIIHDAFKPMPDRFKDYISIPKNNGYRSIHTTVISRRGLPCEVQIRTFEMHHQAEYGVAAHWKYKVGIEGAKTGAFEEKMQWIRQMLEAKDEASGDEDLRRAIKTELTSDDVFVFTPKGEVRVLPQGASIVDFAYAIHSAVGNRMIGAKVNGKIAPLDTELISGTVVEILTTQAQGHGPSKDWLKIAKTSEARNKIRQWFKKEKREENIADGQDEFEREIRRIAPRITPEQIEQIVTETVKRNHFLETEDFYASLGYGGISMSKMLPKLREDCQKFVAPEQPEPVKIAPVKEKSHLGGVIVQGFDNCLTKFARCCNPVPGDDIIGFTTRGGGVAIHRQNCPNVAANQKREPERWLEVSWAEKSGEVYKAALSVVTEQGLNIFNQISALLAADNIFTEGIMMVPRSDNSGEYSVMVRVGGSQQLKTLVNKLTAIPGVLYVKRV